MVGDLWVALIGDGEAGIGWPCVGVVGVAGVKGGVWERTSSGVGAPRRTLRTR